MKRFLEELDLYVRLIGFGLIFVMLVAVGVGLQGCKPTNSIVPVVTPTILATSFNDLYFSYNKFTLDNTSKVFTNTDTVYANYTIKGSKKVTIMIKLYYNTILVDTDTSEHVAGNWTMPITAKKSGQYIFSIFHEGKEVLVNNFTKI